MKKLIFIITFQSFFGVLFLNAQPPGGGYYPNRPSISEHNRYSNCPEPFSEVHFNRDYPGLANTSLRYRDYEIRSYIRYKCLSSDQIRRLASLYATDRERERFLIYSFNFVFNLEDYSITAMSLVTVPTRNDFYQFLASKGIATGDLVYVYPPNYNPYYPNTNPNNYPNYTYPPQNNNGGYNNNYPPPANSGTNNNYPNNNNNGNNNSNYPPSQNNNGYTLEPQAQGKSVTPPPANSGVNNNYPNNNNNYAPNNRPMMSFQNFENLKTQISQKSFEKERLELANQSVTQNFLTANQISGIMQILAFDNNRLDFAKYAYPYVYDKENYALVTNALSFDSNKKALKDFLNSASAKH